MAKRTREVELESDESELPQEKQACLTPRRHEAHSRRKLVLHTVSPRHFPMRQIKNSPVRRSIQRCMTVLKVVKPNQASKKRRTKIPLKAWAPSKATVQQGELQYFIKMP